ncbi:FxSxx-COOH cyclophane-containing RiPP peptide [Streptomyces sp. NPDC020983]|uniref:FxSxx-COOH cyclophane-containing RiPP peptide n=1 Tax=Streptomyces sp. NPDC020983 TaxID=3365106 RepID=UPI00379BFACE
MHTDPHDPEPAPDVLALDLESLRTVDHPVLAALVEDLRERVAAPGGGALWGFDNAM